MPNTPLHMYLADASPQTFPAAAHVELRSVARAVPPRPLERRTPSGEALWQARWRIAAESTGQLLFEWDMRSGYVEILALPREWAQGPVAALPARVSDWMRLIHPEDRSGMLAALRRHLAGGPGFAHECRLAAHSQMVISCRGAVLRDASGRPFRFVGALAGITVQRQQQQEQARLAALVQSSTEAMIGTGLDGAIRFWNAGAEALCGYSAADVLGCNLLDLIVRPERAAMREILAGIAADQPPRSVAVGLASRSGAEIAVAVRLSPVRDTRGAVAEIAWTGRGVAGLAPAVLSAAVLQAQDETMRKIGRELHDSTAQNVAALAMHLAVLRAESSPRSRNGRMVRECLRLAEESCRELRSTAYLLHPPLLEEFGLLRALRTYAHGFAKRTGIRVRIQAPAPLPRLAEPIEISLFRIVQEALANVHRHSGSRTALVAFAWTPAQLTLEVRDRGRGFGMGTARHSLQAPDAPGVGLLSIRERARQAGGTLDISSGDQGTTLRITVPREVQP